MVVYEGLVETFGHSSWKSPYEGDVVSRLPERLSHCATDVKEHDASIDSRSILGDLCKVEEPSAVNFVLDRSFAKSVELVFDRPLKEGNEVALYDNVRVKVEHLIVLVNVFVVEDEGPRAG